MRILEKLVELKVKDWPQALKVISFFIDIVEY